MTSASLTLLPMVSSRGGPDSAGRSFTIVRKLYISRGSALRRRGAKNCVVGLVLGKEVQGAECGGGGLLGAMALKLGHQEPQVGVTPPDAGHS